LALRRNRCSTEHMLGQAFALCGVEHGEALEKRHRIGFATLARHALQFAARREAVGVADRRAALALLGMAAEGQSLPEGQPMLCRISFLTHRTPENEDV